MPPYKPHCSSRGTSSTKSAVDLMILSYDLNSAAPKVNDLWNARLSRMIENVILVSMAIRQKDKRKLTPSFPVFFFLSVLCVLTSRSSSQAAWEEPYADKWTAISLKWSLRSGTFPFPSAFFWSMKAASHRFYVLHLCVPAFKNTHLRKLSFGVMGGGCWGCMLLVRYSRFQCGLDRITAV